MTLAARIKKIKALVVDVDGVLTDGKIIFDSAGKETKNFNVYDGFGLVFLKRAGFKTAIITARGSKTVSLRAKDLNIDRTYQDAFPKLEAYKKFLKEFRLRDEQICFIADDLPDLQVLKRVGFAVSVSNGVDEIKRAAHYVTKKKGGGGAVRETIELILKAQGKWQGVLARYE